MKDLKEEEIPSWTEIRAVMAESSAEWEKRQKKADERGEQLDKRLDKLDKSVTKLKESIIGVTNNIGHHAEQYFQHALSSKLEFGGEKYDKLIKNLKFEGKESCEFDILMVNGKSVALIEAKNRIHPNFIEQVSVKKVAQFRKYFPEYKDYKLYLGIAGFSFDDFVIEKAKERGIGILRQVGKSIEIDDNKLKAY